MRRPSNELPEIYLCVKPVDFRKGIDGLAALIEGKLKGSPFSERLFVFVNRKRDKVRILYWERNGFCLWMKRLEEERFKWPSFLDDEVATLTGQQLNWLLDGYDLKYLKGHRELSYQTTL